MDGCLYLSGGCGIREKTYKNGGKGKGTEIEENIDHHIRWNMALNMTR